MTSTKALPKRKPRTPLAVGLLPAPREGASTDEGGYFTPKVNLRRIAHPGCVTGCPQCRDVEAVVYLAGDDAAVFEQTATARDWSRVTGVPLGCLLHEESPNAPLADRPRLRKAMNLAKWHPNAVLLIGDGAVRDMNEAEALEAMAAEAGIQVVRSELAVAA